MRSLLKNKFFWLGLLIAIFMMGFMRHTAVEREDVFAAEKMIRTAYSPLQNGVNRVRGHLVEIGSIFSSKTVLVNQNQRLHRQINELKQQNQTLLEYQYENQRLRQMLDFRDRHREEYRLEAAEVIARSPENWHKTMTINRGEVDGISRNLIVVTPQGLVGRVTACTDTSSEVLLILDRESAIGALIQTSRTQGIVEGHGDQNQLRMVNIPYDSSIRNGQTVVTSGLSEIFPPGLRIGEVTDVGHESNGLLKYAVIKPSVDFDKLEEVFVIQPVK